MEKRSLTVGVFTALIKFGLHIRDVDIAIVACRLFRDALAPATKSTYKTGVRHFQRFRSKYPKAPLPPDEFTAPRLVSISLAFFAAYLFELESIKSYGTIRNYMSHVTQLYVKKGYPKEKRLDSPLLKAVMRGVKRSMPPEADTRVAFLLLHYELPRRIKRAKCATTKKVISELSFGFFARLRFHSYSKFCMENLTLVLKGGKGITPSLFSRETVLNLLTSNGIIGFYFTFDDKFHPGARAYYCKVGDIHHTLKRLCPVKQLSTLIKISHNDMFFRRMRSLRLF